MGFVHNSLARDQLPVRRVGMLIFPQFQLLDAAGPIAAFEVARELGVPYELSVLAARAGTVRSSSGAGMSATDLLESPTLDTLIVAGGQGARSVVSSDPMVRFLWEATLVEATRPRRIASVCTGSYILAHAGLLNGRRATTHWSHARHFAECFPRVKVEPDRIFIRQQSIWTSAGVTAGIDLSLALIEEDAGQAVARRVARQLVVYYRRSGGQSQFSAILEMGPVDHRFVRLMRWMREHLHEDLRVPGLAERLAMSARQFARAFTADVGITPARAVERLRLEVARERIECGTQSIERIALDTGFGNTERMRRAFTRAFGQPPGALRRAGAESIATVSSSTASSSAASS